MHELPDFVNNHYFCDTGNRGIDTFSASTIYTQDPLWDGKGCGSLSSCCELNMPPWFCTSLSQPTDDDLELRNCYSHNEMSADKLITLIEIYVK